MFLSISFERKLTESISAEYELVSKISKHDKSLKFNTQCTLLTYKLQYMWSMNHYLHILKYSYIVKCNKFPQVKGFDS